MSGTEDPPTARGADLIPGDHEAPATNPATAETLTADKVKPLIEKEIG